jgi:hypothetical protein
MLRRAPAPDPVVSDAPPDFERHLLRLSVEGLSEERARCSDCGRTPLIGEEVHTYVRGQIVCELCRQLRPAVPLATQRVRHSEFGHTVRLRRVA